MWLNGNTHVCKLYLICMFMNINENMKMRKIHRTLTYFNPKPSLFHVVSSVIQYDMFFHPIVLYENFLIFILLNINENLKNRENHEKYYPGE